MYIIVRDIKVVEAGADPNVRAYTGTTPLHHARTAEVVTALVEAGADPERADCVTRYTARGEPGWVIG